MKKLAFLLALVFLPLGLAAQNYEVKDGSVVFSSVIEGTGSVEELHSALESFFALRFNDVNSTLKLNQPDRLLYKGLFSNCGSFAMGMWTVDAPYSLEVGIKEGRVRVKITLTEAVYRSTGGSAVRFDYRVALSPPFTAKCSNSSVSKKDCAAAFAEMEARCNAWLADVDNLLKTPAASADDDW